MKITTKKLLSFPKNSGGFTLVEMMIVMAISGVIMGAVYSAYLAQQRTYLAQDQVAEMQQNLRAAIFIVSRELRMAGYDLTGDAGAGTSTALPGQISFTADLDADGALTGSGETIDIGFQYDPDDSDNSDDYARDGVPDIDSDGDGVPDAVSLRIQKNGGGYQEIAENIQAIEFNYLDKDLNKLTPPIDIQAIHSIQLSILARAEKPDRSFVNTREYTPASGTPWDLNGAAVGNAANDHFRRRLLITTIQCRNMGL